MPDIEILAPFALACLALYLTPGADLAYIISRTARYGFRTGIVCALAVFVGISVHILAAGLGVAAILKTSQVAFTVIKYAGAAYLLYLAYQIIKDSPAAKNAESDEETPNRSVFWEGILINLLNPKISLFMLAFLPQFVDPSQGSGFSQLMILGFLFNGGGLVWSIFVIFCVTRLKRRLALSSGFQTILRWVVASVLGGLAVRLSLTDR